MAKYSPRLPLASGETPVVNFDDSDWQRIEAPCRWTLSTELREDIRRVTEEFLTYESSERTAARFADVKVVLEAYDKAASRFFKAVFADPSGQFDASVYAQHLIERNSRELRTGGASIFDAMHALLRVFHIGCNASLKQLNEPQNDRGRSSAAKRLGVRVSTLDAAEIVAGQRKPSMLSKEQCPRPFE